MLSPVFHVIRPVLSITTSKHSAQLRVRGWMDPPRAERSSAVGSIEHLNAVPL